MRVVSIIAVIIIHTGPFKDDPTHVGASWDVATIINQLARFAVPFFFIVSGYLWAQRINHESDVYPVTFNMGKRVMIVFAVWCAIYLLPTDFSSVFESHPSGWLKQLYVNIRNMAKYPVRTLLNGTKYHLWFLPALLCALTISAFFIKRQKEFLLASLAVILYLVALFGKPYSDTSIGFHSSFNLRNGPFISLLFFVTGYFLQKLKTRPSWLPLGIMLSVLGIILHFAELYVLHEKWGITMRQDFLLGTYFYGLGIALIALSGTRILNSERIALIGPSVLGIYTSHPMFVELLRPIGRQFSDSIIWSTTFVAAVFSLSYTLVRIMARFSLTRRFVM